MYVPSSSMFDQTWTVTSISSKVTQFEKLLDRIPILMEIENPSKNPRAPANSLCIKWNCLHLNLESDFNIILNHCQCPFWHFEELVSLGRKSLMTQEIRNHFRTIFVISVFQCTIFPLSNYCWQFCRWKLQRHTSP